MRRTSTISSARACLCGVGVTLALTVVAAWPVIREPRQQLFGHELVGREHDPFTTMEQYAAGHVPPPYLQPATDLPGMALTAAIGAVPAYNLLTLLTFPLAAASAFAHAQYVIRSSTGAAVAAILFAMAPFHLAHAAYHVHIAQVQWLPLFFLALWRLIERPSASRAALAAAALTVAAAASVYLGFFAAVAGAAAAIVGGLAGDRARRWPAIGWTAAAFGAVALLVLAAILVAAPQLLTATDAFAFARESVVQHTAQPMSYFAPPPGHAMLRPIDDLAATPFASRAGLVEQQLGLGVAVCVLAMLGLVGGGRNAPIARLRAPLVTAALVALLCSLPPVVSIGSIALPMPSQALHLFTPMFRAYARFGVIVSLIVTTVAGAGVAVLLGHPSRWSRAVLMALLAVAAVEYLPPRPLSRDVLPTPAHRAIADLDPARVVDCTAQTAGAGAGLRWLMKPEVLIASDALADCVEPGFGQKLAAFGVTHVILRRDAARLGWIANGGAPTGTERRATFNVAALFAVTTPRPAAYVVELTGFYPREFLGTDSWRWMSTRGTIGVANLSNGPRTAWLDLELEPLVATTPIAVTAAGGVRTTWVVTAGRQWYTAGPIALEPGTQAIVLDAGPIASAATLGIAADPRQLSVRVRGWRIRTSD